MLSVQKLVNCVVRRQPFEGDAHQEAEPRLSPEGDEYYVHMAVLTASIGKRVSISPGNVMSRTMSSEMARRGGCVNYLPKTDDVSCLLHRLSSAVQNILLLTPRVRMASDVQLRDLPAGWLGRDLELLPRRAEVALFSSARA